MRRRAARMARPARVLMRARKPWVRLRRRLLGWKVRLLTGITPFCPRLAEPGRRARECLFPARGSTSPTAGDWSTIRVGESRGQTGNPTPPRRLLRDPVPVSCANDSHPCNSTGVIHTRSAGPPNKGTASLRRSLAPRPGPSYRRATFTGFSTATRPAGRLELALCTHPVENYVDTWRPPMAGPPAQSPLGRRAPRTPRGARPWSVGA